MMTPLEELTQPHLPPPQQCEPSRRGVKHQGPLCFFPVAPEIFGASLLRWGLEGGGRCRTGGGTEKHAETLSSSAVSPAPETTPST